MNPALASLLAMIVGWAAPLGGLAVCQMVADGRTTDVWPMAFWTGLFAFAGWLLVVLPVMWWRGEARGFRDLRWSWLGWSLLGMAVFALLTVPWMGPTALIILWYPALMGAAAGPVFALLRGAGGRLASGTDNQAANR